MVKTRQHLVPNAHAITASGTNRCLYIAVHETANRGRGANANAHARLQAGGNSRSASWHWTVDDKEAVQSYLHTTRCWHALGSKYALDAISIEICVNSDGDYDKALQNAAELVAQLRKEYKIPANRVISHKFITGKACPAIMLADGRWDEFIAATDPAGAKKVKAAGAASSAHTPTGGGTAGWPEHNLPRTDKHTKASHNAWVELMAAIGHKNKDLGKNLQSWLNSLTDPRTGKGYYDLSVYNHDGIMGPVGVKALQRKLYDTSALGKKHLYYGVADGHRGPVTVRAEIDYLNWQRKFLA